VASILADVCLRCRFSEPFKDEFKRIAAEYAPQGIQFLQVDCSQAEDFCTSRRPMSLPFVEVFVPNNTVRSTRNEVVGRGAERV